MSNKLTSAEWLFDKLWEEPKDKFAWHSILKQAKEMEAEQIKRAFIHGSQYYRNTESVMPDAEDYYTKTYKL